jgi:DHA1 family tetracycline resistance protein-like MFS transporter
MNGKLIFSILLVVFIDLFGLSLVIPLLPGYVMMFNATETTGGLLFAVYALMQMFGAPILGRLSDQYGRRPILIFSIIGTAVGFVTMGLATSYLPSLELLFVARTIAGISGGNLSVAQAYIADVTDAKNRAKGLGLIGATFGLGFIFGPATGGILSELVNVSFPSYLAGALCLVNLALVRFWLPESLPVSERERRRLEAGTSAPIFSFEALFGALMRPFVGSLLVTRAGITLAGGLVQTVSGFYLIRKFELSPSEIAYVLTYVGVLSVIVQGFLASRINARVREDRLITACVGLMATAMMGWALAPTLLMFNLNQIPMSIALGLLTTLMSSTLSKAVAAQEVGGMLGLGTSIDSAMRAVSPIIGGFLLERYGPSAPGGFGAIVCLIAFGYVFTTIYNHPIALRLKNAAAFAGPGHVAE